VEFFGDGSSIGVRIEYSQEKDALLGTAGSVKKAEALLEGSEDFIVYYGDNLTGMDFDRFVSFHKKWAASRLWLSVRSHRVI